MNTIAHVGVVEAKKRYSELMERARAGEEIIITKYGKPWARMIPLDHDPADTSAESANPT